MKQRWLLVDFLIQNKDLLFSIIAKLDRWADVAHLFATCKQMRQRGDGIWKQMLNHFYPFSKHPPEVREMRDNLQWPKTHQFEFFQCFLLAIHLKYGTITENAEKLYGLAVVLVNGLVREELWCVKADNLKMCVQSMHMTTLGWYQLRIDETPSYWRNLFTDRVLDVPGGCYENDVTYVLQLTEYVKKDGKILIDKEDGPASVSTETLTLALLQMWVKDGKIANPFPLIPK